MKEKETTLLIPRKENKILLARKKRGFGLGKLNGIGGKLEKGETPEEAMLRETEEEISIIPRKYEKIGIIYFSGFQEDKPIKVKMHLYITTEWENTPQESEEVIPRWFKIDNLPKEEMFEDINIWLPYLLENKKITGYFSYDKNWNLINQTITVEKE